MRLFLAFRVFFIVLFRRTTAVQVQELIDARPISPKSTETLGLPSPVEAKPGSTKPSIAASSKLSRRSDSLTLISALQRDARLLDLVFESLDEYNDVQIGAAARDVLRDTRKSLDRMFGLKHLIDTPEGESVDIPPGASPVRWRLVGKESGKNGTVSHPGWQATRLDLPQWTGGADDSLVIAAAEVET